MQLTWRRWGLPSLQPSASAPPRTPRSHSHPFRLLLSPSIAVSGALATLCWLHVLVCFPPGWLLPLGQLLPFSPTHPPPSWMVYLHCFEDGSRNLIRGLAHRLSSTFTFPPASSRLLGSHRPSNSLGQLCVFGNKLMATVTLLMCKVGQSQCSLGIFLGSSITSKTLNSLARHSKSSI